MQGYYIGSSTMQPVLYNQGVSGDLSITDSIDVIIYEQNAPYSVVTSTRVLLHTDGTVTCLLPSLSGDYYIGVKNRNNILTWSSVPVTISSIPANYDFTTYASQAMGSNMTEVEPGIWALYTGEIVEDENIDLVDDTELELGIVNFDFGYVATDLNGDGNVDLLDSQVIDENITNFIYSVHP